MPLTSGTRLGPYEIHTLLGAGGMGEVYRARDTRLDRDVAIKVLPALGSMGAMPSSSSELDERVARFEREAKAVAALARTDLFAFGAVLYEMISGRRAFEGSTAADTMTAILTQEPPDIASLRKDVTPPLDRVIRHCLEKNPGERFQSARDIAFALESLSGLAPERVSGPASVAAPVTRRWVAPAALAATAAISVMLGLAYERSRVPEPTRLQFEARTWERQWITNARFGPDGRTVVFSAAKTGSVPSLYVIQPGALTPQPIGEPGMHLLAVSSKGEIAAITGARLAHHRLFTGTLARVTLEGASRPWMENVFEADFSPDGAALAIVRQDGGRWQLEYPVGTVLYTAPTGYVSDLRVSPDASRVAFFDHPGADDNRGVVKVVDREKRVTVLSAEFSGLEGLAWSPDSRSVLFVSQDSVAQSDVTIAPVDGASPRQVFANPGHAVMSDISGDGRVLLTRGDRRSSLRAQVPGDTVEREFPWLDATIFPSLSHDGHRLVFEDVSQSAGTDYQVALRDVAANTVVRLGTGTALGISPDGAWAVAHIPSTLKMMVYPTGLGDPIALARAPIDLTMIPVQWFSNSRQVLYCGREVSSPSRCYTQEIRSGDPKTVTPDGVTSALLAGDDQTLLIRQSTGAFYVMPIGGVPVEARGFESTDRALTWTTDRRVVVAGTSSLPARIDVVDPWTGRREFVRELAPPDRSGVVGLDSVFWLADGRGYAYTYQHTLDQLYVVTGWKRDVR